MLMMFPFEAPTIFEGIHKSYFRMPRVVKDQKNKFENDDLFRQLSHESAVKYTGFKDRPLEERQMKFVANCQEGHTEVSVVQSGIQFTLMFNPTANPAFSNEGCDFNKELGKVHIKAGFILNGVCVLWRGWVDLQRLEGFGCLEFDEYRAYLEDAMLKQQLDKQQACNNNNNNNNSINRSNNNHQTSPLNNQASHHPHPHAHPHHAHLDAAAAVVANQRLTSAAAAAAAAAAAVGLNPACLGAPPPAGLPGHHQVPVSAPPPLTHLQQATPHNQQQQQTNQSAQSPLNHSSSTTLPPNTHTSPLHNNHLHHHHQNHHNNHNNNHHHQHQQQLPHQQQIAPVTLADTSSYYGNAAIAAAAAAAFHQAFNHVGGIGIPPPQQQQQQQQQQQPAAPSLPLTSNQQHQAVRNLHRFSSGNSLATAANSVAGLQSAPKLELH